MEKFQIGDVVSLKSGSRAMTIIELKTNIDPIKYKVVWHDKDGKEHTSVYPGEALTKETGPTLYTA